jgi:hypothetical protein
LNLKRDFLVSNFCFQIQLAPLQQGGNDYLHTKSQISDQIMERGNLALVGNITLKRPVRVTRKNACKGSYTGSIFTYDGLWDVVEHWEEKGIAGFVVFKYRLRRQPGQAALGIVTLVGLSLLSLPGYMDHTGCR